MFEAQSTAVPSRRGFVAGALALLAAPVVVKASSLMRVAPTEIIRPAPLLRVGEVLRIRLPNDYVVTDGPALIDIQGPATELREFVVTEEVQRRADRLHLTIEQITKEAIRHFQNSNEFIKNLDAQYERDFEFMKGEQWAYNKERRSLDRVDPVLDKLALAVAAPVVVAKALEQPVTRRFWSNRSKNDG